MYILCGRMKLWMWITSMWRRLLSTDAGVAFLIRTDGEDYLSCRGSALVGTGRESRRRTTGGTATLFKRRWSISPAKELDVSFVVLDPRQEEAGTWGMDYFLKHVRSRYIFPMHCWNNYRMIREYKAKNDAKYPTCEIMGITGPGQEFVLE